MATIHEKRRQAALDNGLIEDFTERNMPLSVIAAKHSLDHSTVRAILKERGLYKPAPHHAYLGCSTDEREAYIRSDGRISDYERTAERNHWLCDKWELSES